MYSVASGFDAEANIKMLRDVRFCYCLSQSPTNGMDRGKRSFFYIRLTGSSEFLNLRY